MGVVTLHNLAAAYGSFEAGEVSLSTADTTATGVSVTSLDASTRKYGLQSLKMTVNYNFNSREYIIKDLSGNAVVPALTEGHKYYTRIDFMSDYGYEWQYKFSPEIQVICGQTLLDTGYILYGPASVWQRCSQIVTASAAAAAATQLKISGRLSVKNTNQSTASQWYDGLAIVDLTAVFGAGNEPTQAWCDEHIPFFPDALTVA